MSENNNNTQVVELTLESIAPSFGNDRTVFDDAAIEQLAASIKANGLVQPITVREIAPGQYQLIAGERRYRAHKLLGREFIRAIIAPMDDAQAAAAMLVENTGRKDLDPIDEARAYARRRDDFKWDDAQIADCAGVSIQIVRNRIKLLSLNAEIQHLVRTGNLQVGYANVIADAELDKNRQRIAMGRLIQNPAPTIAWFRRECAELAAAQAQNAMFDDSFDFSATTGQNVNAATVKLPADPRSDTAPMVGKTYREMMQNRINFWRDAADQWDRYGKGANRDRCLAAAKECESLLAVMPADHNFRGKRVKRGNKVLVIYTATVEPVAPVIEIPEPAPVVIEPAAPIIVDSPVIEPVIEAAPVVIEPAAQSIEEILANTPIPAMRVADSDTLDLEPFGALPALDTAADKALPSLLAAIEAAENDIRAAIKANWYRIEFPQLALLNERATDARRNLMIHLVKNCRVA